MKARSQSSSIRTKHSDRSGAVSAENASKPLLWTCKRCFAELRRLGWRRNMEGMARYGIRAKIVYGVSKPKLDVLAKQIGKDHQLSLQLWDSGVHDARILAGMVDLAEQVTAPQMERWVSDFDNWDVCDGTCCHLFTYARPAWQMAIRWSGRPQEFQKRAGFALMA